jgi:hypothetical protein
MVAAFTTIDDNSFALNGRVVPKVYQLDPFRNHPEHVFVVNTNDREDYLLRDWKLSEISVDGVVYASIQELSVAITPVIFAGSSSAGTTTLLQQIADNTAEDKVNNWHLAGTGALLIEANSQRSITIKAVTDCEVTIKGVTATWLEGDVVTFGNGSAEILNDIEIVSGEWFAVGNGTMPTL